MTVIRFPSELYMAVAIVLAVSYYKRFGSGYSFHAVPYGWKESFRLHLVNYAAFSSGGSYTYSVTCPFVKVISTGRLR